MGKYIDETGNMHGKLYVIGDAGRDKHGKALFLCQCFCGKYVVYRGYEIRAKKYVSCGCYSRDLTKEMDFEKGFYGTKLYNCYYNMIRRCYSDKFVNYHDYGGRGISVCDEWRSNRASFFRWAIKAGYREGLEIDRIDNEGDYTPDNCRWVTHRENMKNTRRSYALSAK